MRRKKPIAVCVECFVDYALQDFVNKNLEFQWCNFCGKKSKKLIGGALEIVVSYFKDCLDHDYDNPEDHLFYDREDESGWATGGLVRVYDGYDLVHEEFSDCFNSEDLREYFSDSVSDCQFIKKNFERFDASELYKYSWEEFTQTVKYHRRFIFSVCKRKNISEEDDEIIEPANFVSFISNLILQHSLVTKIPIGTCFYRVRIHNELLEKSAKSLGTCPIDQANYSNRMSPAGIPMFYGALDKETALIESRDDEMVKVDERRATIGIFQTLKPLTVVDFTKMPAIPSLFDDQKRELRDGISTLISFVRDLSSPIKKDGREHIEYVPTQIITEHIRDLFKFQKRNVDGIYYPSSHNGKTACVFFLSNEQCTDNKNDEKGILLLKENPKTININ